MRVICVGDVVGQPGVDFLSDRLPVLKKACGADFVVVNGENADKSGVGIARNTADTLLQYADVVTTGNHCYRKASEDLYTENPVVLHPANYPYTENEAGSCVVDLGRLGTVQVINLSGLAFLEPLDSPFARADALLYQQEARFRVVDFHAESTAEKKAMGYYLDGRVGAMFGTHTHVQTADEQILPKGTGYITDVGMTGPAHSVLGVEPSGAVKKQREHVPVQFKVAEGPAMLNAAVFDLDDRTGMCREVRRVIQREDEKFSVESISWP